MRTAITVSDLCDLYLAGAKSRIKASTWAMDRSRIETHVKPLIGQFTVRSLTTANRANESRDHRWQNGEAAQSVRARGISHWRPRRCGPDAGNDRNNSRICQADT